MNHMRELFIKLGFTASMLLWASIAVTPATAAIIQYSFTGTVDKVNSQLSSEFNTSQLMSGLMTVNTSDTNILTTIGNYAITPFSLNIGGYTATMGTSGQVEIRNGLPGLDGFNVTVNAPNGLNVNFLAPRIFEIQLRGPASIFSNDALPTTPPSVSAFSNFNQWRLVFGPGVGIAVSGIVTNLTVVPLPTAVILFGAGLISLVGLGAGGLRNLRWPQA
ncbi:MAG TPA: hypothetical protein VGQ08_15155 [Nitrospiraceae bacterium]|jgi:hypothetical protein|nr:hypothetical protein [Nitrospiraceae bacterium]